MITITAGPDQGAKVGMSGALLKADGSHYMSFTIETTGGASSTAFVTRLR